MQRIDFETQQSTAATRTETFEQHTEYVRYSLERYHLSRVLHGLIMMRCTGVLTSEPVR